MIRKITLAAVLLASPAFAQEQSFTRGPATIIDPGMFECGGRDRVSAVGEITAEDGTVWTVPADTLFETAPKATDLYDVCTGVTPSGMDEVDLDDVPVVDLGGDEVFTALIFADNYFELSVDGQLIAVDSVPFTPFNSSVVRFRASRPMTLAVKLVDWEENLGLGSERGRGSAFQPGDGGLVMVVRDEASETVAITDDTWRAQTFYIAPIKERDCLRIEGAHRDSSACDTSGSDDGTGYSGAHWPIPDGWRESGFDDSGWPMAVTYTNDTVGIDNKPGYTNFRPVFDAPEADAQFIWSSNLILDNLVLVRKTIE